MFSRRRSGQRRRVMRTGPHAEQRRDDGLHGPRAFPLDRLLAIFYSITADDGVVVDSASDIYHQIASLVSLHLLARASGGADGIRLDGVRLKCNIALDTATAIARQLGLDLTAYLADEAAP